MYSDELLKQRSAKENTAKTRSLLKQTFLQVVGRDSFDGPLYEHAVTLFHTRNAPINEHI